MAMSNLDKNQTKLIIGRNDYNVPLDHFARFFLLSLWKNHARN